MFYDTLCVPTFFTNQFGKFVKIQGRDYEVDEKYWVYLKYRDYLSIEKSFTLNRVFDNYPHETLVFLIHGSAPIYICPKTQENKINHNAYLTNSSVNSIVFYADAFLNNQGFSLSEIFNLRQKYSLGNSNHRYFTKNELKNSFVNQSDSFINVYKYMNEQDRFVNFVTGLDTEQFKRIFSKYESPSHVIREFTNLIYHSKFECNSIINNYVYPGQVHTNSGVSAKKNTIKESKFYVFEQRYLENLKIKECGECENILY